MLLGLNLAYSQTKEECVKYIKTRFQSRYKETPISVKLIGTTLTIKTPSLGKDNHISEADLKFLEDVDLYFDESINVYQVNLIFSKKCYLESIELEEGGKENFSPKSTFMILGFDKNDKSEAEKLKKVVKRLAKHCGAKVLDI